MGQQKNLAAEPGVFGSPATHSAEDAGCIERTPCAPARVVQIERTTLEPFRPSTEGCARRHIRDLQLQDFRGGRSAAEQNELDNTAA
jgi:hypothetical protein